MRGYIFIFCFIAAAFSLSGQTTDGLFAYYSFNDSTAVDQTGSGSLGVITGNPSSVCGVDGLALRLDGDTDPDSTDQVIFIGIISTFFENDDFSFGFFMNPVNTGGTQTIFSKREACDDENAFAIRYNAAPNTITVELSENATKKVSLTATLDFNKCWQHVGITRDGGTVRLYVNGVLEETGTTLSRIDISSGGALNLGAGQCVGVTDNPYGGVIDEVRIYDRSLSAKEVKGLYEPLIPDNIITADATLFLGNELQIEMGKTCADTFFWTPQTGVMDTFDYEPILSPEETTTYTISFIDDVLACNTFDTIKVTVIDPADLDCRKVFLPNAFTPNGDGLNDTYGISNPYAVTQLVSFEIFDRWGGRVFMTENPMDRWDGSFKGQLMNPGVLLYKVIFECDGEEIVNVGSLSIIR